MSSIYGENLKLSIFGQSHGKAIGMVLDGIPAGLPVDENKLADFMARRMPGTGKYVTSRKEPDKAIFLSGIVDGYTCGAPICAVIENKDPRPGDYASLSNTPRPGHADYTAQVKYGGFQDTAGGGHFSGRLTAPLCIAGGLCKQWLEEQGIHIGAHITEIGLAHAQSFDYLNPQLEQIGQMFPTLTAESAEEFQHVIEKARSQGESVGGRVECAVTGVPAGLGEPMFGGVENRIAAIVYGIPGVKAVGFGWSESFAITCGSDSNDAFAMNEGSVTTLTNHCGGILGGITTGMPVIFDVTFKPTPSIAKPQQTVDLLTGRNVTVKISGRHDPCIAVRAVPVVEAAAAIALYDMILGNTQTDRRKQNGYF